MQNYMYFSKDICTEITIISPALSKESSVILLLFLNVHPSEQMLLKLYVHLKAQKDSIGHVLWICNKVLEFSFCLLGQTRVKQCSLGQSRNDFCKLFSSNSEPLGQFKPNLEQPFLGEMYS